LVFVLHESARFFFSIDTPTTQIYTLSLHDALPISAAEFSEQVTLGMIVPSLRASAKQSRSPARDSGLLPPLPFGLWRTRRRLRSDRKSTRLNSSHVKISYAVFCLKKKRD